jgi:DNA-directed RNA polymerase specialized sigma24 family protein
MLRAVVRRHRVSSKDAADVVQTTWLRLAENLDRLHDPARIGG